MGTNWEFLGTIGVRARGPLGGLGVFGGQRGHKPAVIYHTLWDIWTKITKLFLFLSAHNQIKCHILSCTTNVQHILLFCMPLVLKVKDWPIRSYVSPSIHMIFLYQWVLASTSSYPAPSQLQLFWNPFYICSKEKHYSIISLWSLPPVTGYRRLVQY